jgi:hypothetical protein
VAGVRRAGALASSADTSKEAGERMPTRAEDDNKRRHVVVQCPGVVVLERGRQDRQPEKRSARNPNGVDGELAATQLECCAGDEPVVRPWMSADELGEEESFGHGNTGERGSGAGSRASATGSRAVRAGERATRRPGRAEELERQSR